MTHLPPLLGLALIAIACYKIGYQRCRDTTGKGVVIAKTILTWQEFLAITHYKTARVTVQGCVITGRPESISTEDDLRHFLSRWGCYAKDFRLEDNRFLEEGL